MVGLTVDSLSVRFTLPDARVAAVSDVSFSLAPGECLALVGESGCGKSVLASALLGFLPGNAEVAGSAMLGPLDLLAASDQVLSQQVRGRQIGLVPQSPAAHLTPVRTARAQLDEALRHLHPAETRPSADEVAKRAGLQPADLDLYPHQLSGGMAQRVATALALAGDPWMIIADEPTTGLDRALVDALVAELRLLVADGRAVLLITHDLAAARRVADRIAVMYAGRLVEVGPAHEVLDSPRHPYARGLVDSLPDRAFTPIRGLPPVLTDLPPGCAFGPRCDRVTAECSDSPQLTVLNGHAVACHNPC
ncbi:ABC transporter ATP-binding protein [Kibdelosporangium persicum]|uniref:Nickel import system ATP-binding protein NikD n=1 Tax=Kibdelosporangium persicum TaxID=2698649 RepID=A0ABX2FIM2_9PSEU|nr:ABC transporter ATP-binding protein [Kibdelosporangium persicum]NRN70573.1 Oligopeptide transport ATP-binding protein OppD [Kibdelosporangium persicum]